MLFAAAFTLEVRHATTLANGPADALSRRDRARCRYLRSAARREPDPLTVLEFRPT